MRLGRPRGLLAPVEDATAVELPPRFAEALTGIRAAISHCAGRGIPGETVLAALMTEAMPRLLESHGPDKAAVLLRGLAEGMSRAEGEGEHCSRPPLSRTP